MTIAEQRQKPKRSTIDYVAGDYANDKNNRILSTGRCSYCNRWIPTAANAELMAEAEATIESEATAAADTVKECRLCATQREPQLLSQIPSQAQPQHEEITDVNVPGRSSSFSTASRTCSSIGEEPGDLISAIGSPITSQKSTHDMTPSANTSADAGPAHRKPTGETASMRRHFLGSILVNLPEGTVMKCQPTGPGENVEGVDFSLATFLAPGASLLRQLHEKGAQTLLLNAFCGQPKRRMYARLKWGEMENICACEFLCEFSMDGRNPALRLADIQIYCIDTATTIGRSVTVTGESRHIFTTRHNSSCAVIYLDSASIPVLGHFPSEIAGKSLFALIHADDDVETIKRAHRQLRERRGGEIVGTPGLHFRTYRGGAVRVDSEWTAFVNPWTGHVEMIVGRHTVDDNYDNGKVNGVCIMTVTADQLRRHDTDIYEILSKPATVPHVSNVVCAPTATVEVDENNNTVDNNNPPATVNSVEKKRTTETANVEKTSNTAVDRKVEADSPAISLSYNQINCLENVHRLLKSQAKTLDDTVSRNGLERDPNLGTPTDRAPTGLPLTRELLEMHDRKWETECKYSWRKRLANKRVAVNPPDTQSEPKIQRTVANSHTNSTSINEHCRTSFVTPKNNNNNKEPPFLPSPSPNNTSEESLRYADGPNTVATLNDYLATALQYQIQTLIQKQQKQQQQKLCLTPQTVALMNNLFLQYKQQLQQQQQLQ